jgi:Domain of unknown function (DUF1996)
VYATNYVDPIAHTGHLHHQFGNTTTNEQSTGATLKAANKTSCAPTSVGSWFTSAGWFPVAYNDSREVPLAPKNQVIVYYRAPGDPTKVMPIPTGLGIVANRETNYSSNFLKIKHGDRVTVTFPDCWDQDYNTITHAKMAPSHNGNCPPGYPYRIPRISYVIKYSGTINSLTTMVSMAMDAMGPFDTYMHADYLAANQDVFNNTLIDQCLRHGTSGSDPACE